MITSMLRVEPGSFAALMHVRDQHGKVVDVVPTPILAWVLGETGVEYALLLTGPVPVHSIPIWCPEEAVWRGNDAWPSIQAYTKWAREHVQ